MKEISAAPELQLKNGLHRLGSSGAERTFSRERKCSRAQEVKQCARDQAFQLEEEIGSISKRSLNEAISC